MPEYETMLNKRRYDRHMKRSRLRIPEYETMLYKRRYNRRMKRSRYEYRNMKPNANGNIHT